MKTIREQIKDAGKELVSLLGSKAEKSNTVKNARDWWKTGSLYSNHDTDVLRSLQNALYKIGYTDGYMGKVSEGKSEDYENGFDAGNCDRPTLEEKLPIDVAKEQNNWWV